MLLFMCTVVVGCWWALFNPDLSLFLHFACLVCLSSPRFLCCCVVETAFLGSHPHRHVVCYFVLLRRVSTYWDGVLCVIDCGVRELVPWIVLLLFSSARCRVTCSAPYCSVL